MARRRGPRGDVTLPLLVEAAEQVLAARGNQGLTLRAVAQQAGVSPNAVYTYVEDMDDLRQHVADAFLGRLDLSLLTTEAPSESFTRFLLHVLGVLGSSPGHVALLTSDRIGGPHALALNEALLRFFVDGVGHTLGHAAACTGLVTEWVHGALLLSHSSDTSPAFGRALARSDLTRYPLTAATPPEEVSDAVGLLTRAVLSPTE